MVLVTAVEPGDQWAGIEEGGTPIVGAAHGRGLLSRCWLCCLLSF
ncbi:hypothetical protein [Vulcanococcus limneticus]